MKSSLEPTQIALKLILDELEIVSDWNKINYDLVARVLEDINKKGIYTSGYIIRNGVQIFPDTEDELYNPRLNNDLDDICYALNHNETIEHKLQSWLKSKLNNYKKTNDFKEIYKKYSKG